MSEQTENLTAEQRALLASVHAAENNIGGSTIDLDETGQPKAPQEPENPSGENKAILETLIAILTPALPFLPTVYTPDTIERIANAYTAVEEKYGWKVRDMMGVEVQLLIVAVPPTIQAIVLGRMHFEQLRRSKEKDITPAEGANGSNE
jgi:hypothetical protein